MFFICLVCQTSSTGIFFVLLFSQNIRLFRPVVVAVEYQEDSQTKNNKTQGEEVTDEMLHTVSEVSSILFLVSFLNPSTFISKLIIDLTKMFLNLENHPLMFFDEDFQNLLPVCISDSD